MPITYYLLEPPRLLVSEKPGTNTVFYVLSLKTNFQPHALLKPTHLFDFGHFSYLHIKTPCLLETSE